MKMNSVVHFEMPAYDNDRVSKFYSEVFGWKMKQMGEEMGSYLLAQTTETDEEGMIQTPGAINGGFWKVGPDQKNVPPHVVISVDDLSETIKLVEASGGKKIGEQMEIPGVGHYQAVEDTEGNNIGVLQPASM